MQDRDSIFSIKTLGTVSTVVVICFLGMIVVNAV